MINKKNSKQIKIIEMFSFIPKWDVIQTIFQVFIKHYLNAEKKMLFLSLTRKIQSNTQYNVLLGF